MNAVSIGCFLSVGVVVSIEVKSVVWRSPG